MGVWGVGDRGAICMIYIHTPLEGSGTVVPLTPPADRVWNGRGTSFHSDGVVSATRRSLGY